MSFNWITFLAEIANFIILVWLLTRFFYRPVLQAIEHRRQAVRSELDRANEAKAKADGLKSTYEARLQDWDKEKASLRNQFEQELAGERARREAELHVSLEDERKAAFAQQQQHAEMLRRDAERDAMRRASVFCSALLTRFASPELERRIVDAALEDLETLTSEKRALISRSLGGDASAHVETRFPLDADLQKRLRAALETCAGHPLTLDFRQDDTLLSGLHIDLGTTALEGNLAEELRWFSRNGAP